MAHPIFKKSKIKSSSIKDKRVEKHVASSKSKTSFLEIHDLTNEQGSFYVDLTQTLETGNTHLYKIARNLLIPTLQALPRRIKDSTAYGFIILTLVNKANTGHILNYFVDSNNTVYFIDAQVHNAQHQITHQLNMPNCREEIFYLPSLPPEGNQIKTEKNPERNPMNLAQEFIEKIIKATNEGDRTALLALTKERNFRTPNYQTSFNACHILGQNADKAACEFLVEIGGEANKAWSAFAAGAAYKGNQDLASACKNWK